VKLVFLGPPGAGKGTQAARMAQEFGLRHASTGDIFRAAIAAGTELGRRVEGYINSGSLVPDELTSRVVGQMVVSTCEDYILDGYPRTIQQATDLDGMLEARGESLDGVVYFRLEDELAIRRLTGRLVCRRCGANYHVEFMPPAREGICDRCGGELAARADSAEDVVRARLEEYHQKTRPVIEFYRPRGLLREVDASAPPDDVSAATRALLRALQ